MAIQTLDNFKPERRFVALHISRSGDGKSTAGASYPGPYHELDTDMRFGGIYGSVKQGVIEGKGISFEQFSPLGGWEPISKALEQLNLMRIASMSGQSTFKYGTIGLGSLGSLERIILNMARREAKDGKGHSIVGGLMLTAPGDFRLANAGVHQVLDYLQDCPCNVVATAHIIPRWGKLPSVNPEDVYKPAEIIGETLNFHDNLAESVCARFDNIFRFERKEIGKELKYYVRFAGALAKNAFGIPPGEHEITGKKFYPYLLDMISKYRKD